MNTAKNGDEFFLTRESTRVRALFEGHEIADSADVLVLHENGHQQVRYFPVQDVWMMFLREASIAPNVGAKGETTYFTISRDAKIVERAAWTHKAPPPSLAAIAGRIAFHHEDVEFQVDGLTVAQTTRDAETEAALRAGD